MKTLADFVKIAPYYQKSVQLVNDINEESALTGYICLEAAKKVLATMSQQLLSTNQRAFTWTGAFGSGKSSLALALANYLRNDVVNKNILALTDMDGFAEAFPKSEKKWAIIPLVGSRMSPKAAIVAAIQPFTDCKITSSTKSIFKALDDIASQHDGLLLVIDEMGKLLDSRLDNNDVYFFQQLSEFVNRSENYIVLIGILHQAFRQYAKNQNLSEKVQNEWDKIQGRFSDIPLITSIDETLELLGKVINCPDEISSQANNLCLEVANLVREQRITVSSSISDVLKKAWPLHPVTALLLGAASKKQYGQNERSTFTFINSLEHFGFHDFLLSHPAFEWYSYTPELYWNYLEENMEPAILASLDSPKWITAKACIARAEAKGEKIHVQLIKSIAAIELFKNNSGAIASTEFLKTLFFQVEQKNIEQTLDELQQWKIIVFRKFSNSWAIFEGSDFDLNSALQYELQANKFDVSMLEKLVSFHPVVAKKHLYLTGSLRWMQISLVDSQSITKRIKLFKPNQSNFGQFYLLLDDDGLSESVIDALKEHTSCNIVVGVPSNRVEIYGLAKELSALNLIAAYPQLEGDKIARKELSERRKVVVESLKREISLSTLNNRWYSKHEIEGVTYSNISKLCSQLAESMFSHTPKVISELINRDKPSASSNQARRSLLYKMISSSVEENLGIKGFPAEMGLYLSCLKATKLHVKDEETTSFKISNQLDEQNTLFPLWSATIELVNSKDGKVNVAEIYDFWKTPPFGVKEGMLPLLFWAFYLSNKAQLGLYKDGFYVAEITDVLVDESLQNISKFEIQNIEITPERAKLLKGLLSVLFDMGVVRDEQASPLDAARSLVAMIYRLPNWVKETRLLSDKSMKLREELKRASDPHKVIFHDLAAIFKTDNQADLLRGLRSSLEEIASAYPLLLSELSSLLLRELKVGDGNLQHLNQRAKLIKDTGVTIPDNAFISRIANYDGSDFAIKDILSLIAGKRVEEWSDADVSNVKNRIADFSRMFRKLETITHIHGRNSLRESISLVYATPKSGLFETDIEVDKAQQPIIKEHAAKIIQSLSGLSKSEKLSIMISVLENVEESSHGA